MNSLAAAPSGVTNSPWYQTFFKQDYLDIYGEFLRSRRPAQEADFVYDALALQAGQEMLDVCCGTGRHSVALAKRGLRVTGLDLNADYLAQAEQSALQQGAQLAGIVHADMRAIPFETHFDAVISMFSSFGYLESEIEDAKALAAMARALKPGGRVLLDLLNHEWVILNYQAQDWHQDADGTVYLAHRALDLASGRAHVTFTRIDPAGNRREIVGHHIRLYTLREAIGMLADAGLHFESVSGDFDGQDYRIDTPRMIITASKPA